MPSSPGTLIVGLANNSLHVFDVERRRLATWARQLSASPPTQLTDLREPLIGLALEPVADAAPLRPQSLVAWGANWTAAIRLPADDDAAWPEAKKRRRKSVASAVADDDAGKGRVDVRVSHKHQPLLAFDFLGYGEIVAVERPFTALVGDLPPAFVKPGGRYGT